MLNLKKFHSSNFSFGATAAIVTSIALIVGLNKTTGNPKPAIISALLMVALADNIVDSLSIHIYQESNLSDKVFVQRITVNNFLTRIVIAFCFIAMVFFLSVKTAVIVSIITGLILLTLMSYIIAKNRGINPYPTIFNHLLVAIIVIVASNFLGAWINRMFRK